MTDTREQAAAIVKKAHKYLTPTYNEHEVVMDRGEGCYVWDSEGRRYLDFAAGIAVAALGHAHPKFVEAGKDQLEKLIIYSGGYPTKPKLDCAETLIENSCMDQVFFCNSGTEAVEAAFKLARKWAHETKDENCHEVIAFHNAFHGRTMGAASLTEKRHTQPFFAPYLSGVHFAGFNDLESVAALVSARTAAIIVEPVQGEGGLTPADPAFLKGLRELCDEGGIALIFDEIQCGAGRLGTLFAYEHFGVEPDIITMAKGLGGGFPVGAMLAKKTFGDHLTMGSHGSTFGGNPLATRLAYTVLKEIQEPGFLENVKAMSKHLKKGLEGIKEITDNVTDIRGAGLMVGVDTVFDIVDLRSALQKEGLMTTPAGKNTLRLTPPLIVSETEIDEALDIIKNVVTKESL